MAADVNLDRHGPAWREWIVGNLRAGCSVPSLLAAMQGPTWSVEDARSALRAGVALVQAEAAAARRASQGEVPVPAVEPFSLFISVAAFCEPYLLHTLEDAVRKARHPEWLTFGVVDQTEQARREAVKAAAGAARVRYQWVLPEQSRGACWARSLAFSLWQDESHLLQIDSHMHFDAEWDARLVHGLRQLQAAHGNPRCVITAYPPAFEYQEEVPVITQLDPGTHTMVLRPRAEARLTEEDLRLGFITSHVVGRQTVPACHIAGGFFFTLGTFINEVPYDPYLYFSGEEQSLALRAYTRGWDLWHPPQVPLYHLYKAPNTEHRNHHWHPEWERRRDFSWGELDQRSRRRLGDMILGRADLGAFNLGTVRSLQDYARLSGIDYTARTIVPEYRSRYD